LAEKGAQVDPYCQQCHATGYGLPGGFASVSGTPERTGVGCEDCHGPCEAHRATDTVRTPYFQRAAGQCIRCHDHENSPEFDYETYWPKIEHGIPAPAEPDAEAKEGTVAFSRRASPLSCEKRRSPRKRDCPLWLVNADAKEPEEDLNDMP
jgi:hypothetical protein